ncbi:MAG: NTPase [Aigarchaeota archaeon]|nr:NTPase [Aigarchaeota archaeon]MDW7985729.1 NTPase [Nitrososphaerota archaeon]
MRILYALTGPPGSGKTTAILKVKEILESAKVKIDGMYTEEIRVSSKRVGFKVTRIMTGESGVMAHVDFKTGYTVGKYGVNIRVLEEVGVRGILEGMNSSELIIIDEVGPMELLSNNFITAVRRVLSHQIPAVLTVHYRASHLLVNEVKRAARERLVTLTEYNRDKIPLEISEEILRALGKARL